MEEIFKDIPTYEGMYQVSNLGNVKSLAREIWNGKKLHYRLKEKFLKPSINGAGYYYVHLMKSSERKTINIHKLVAITFLGHTPCGYSQIVDHLNNEPLDNRVENLQIISNRENCSKDKKNGLSKYVGVSTRKDIKKWRACITIEGKNVHLGYFTNEYDAHLAYQNKLKEINNIKTI